MFTSKIHIAKKFKSEDKTLLIELKSEINGRLEREKNGKFIFKCNYPVFSLPIEKENKGDATKEIKKKIIEICIKGIEKPKELADYERVIFYHVKDVISNEVLDNRTLIIGYEENRIRDIKNVILRFNTSCDIIEIEKNVELYLGSKFDDIYNKITKQIKRKKYNKFIIDITNVYLPSDYSNTKKLIEYIESVDGKILFLVTHSDYSKERFIDIFGEKYKDCVMDKIKYLNPDNTFALYQINSILFE